MEINRIFPVGVSLKAEAKTGMRFFKPSASDKCFLGFLRGP
jgi:hypothetical protein